MSTIYPLGVKFSDFVVKQAEADCTKIRQTRHNPPQLLTNETRFHVDFSRVLLLYRQVKQTHLNFYLHC
jgi:hypothetical protein